MKYGANPYAGYDNPGNTQPRLYSGEVDPRLPAMERVIDIHGNGKYKIYPLSMIQRQGVIADQFEGRKLTFQKTPEGFVDEQSGSIWSITGKCISGELKGKTLGPIVHGNHLSFFMDFIGSSFNLFYGILRLFHFIKIL